MTQDVTTSDQAPGYVHWHRVWVVFRIAAECCLNILTRELYPREAKIDIRMGFIPAVRTCKILSSIYNLVDQRPPLRSRIPLRISSSIFRRRIGLAPWIQHFLTTGWLAHSVCLIKQACRCHLGRPFTLVSGLPPIMA